MERVWWHGFENRPSDWSECVMTIGVFDGFHLGHQALAASARRRASQLDLPLLLMTFDPHPRAVLTAEDAPTLLMTVPQRVAAAHAFGADAVLVQPFTRAFAAIPADEFIDRVLVDTLGARAVVIGSKFRFGAGGTGTPETLSRRGATAGFEVDVVQAVELAGQACSSTALRRMFAKGNLETAAAMLGRSKLRVEARS